MVYQKTKWGYILRCEIGEEIINTLMAFALKLDIKFAQVVAIGATNDIILGSFKPGKKVYQERHLTSDYEICSLTGNMARLNNEPILHLHATIADENFNCLGGHLNRAVVSATCEIMLYCSDDPVIRSFDNDSKLTLLDLDSEMS